MDWLDACVHGKLPHYDELDVKTPYRAGDQRLDR